MDIRYWELTYARYIIDFQIKLLGALSVGDVRTGTIPSLLPSQKHYLKVFSIFRIPEYSPASPRRSSHTKSQNHASSLPLRLILLHLPADKSVRGTETVTVHRSPLTVHRKDVSRGLQVVFGSWSLVPCLVASGTGDRGIRDHRGFLPKDAFQVLTATVNGERMPKSHRPPDLMENSASKNLEIFYRLPKIDFLSCLPEEELLYLAGQFRDLRVRKGEIICREGEPGDSLYIIKSGIVSVYVNDRNRDRLIAQLQRGDFFGERAVLTGEPRMATVQAALDVELFELKKADFEGLLRKNPAVGLHISRVISSRFSREGQLAYVVPSQCFISVVGTHSGLGCSTLAARLAKTVHGETGKPVLIIDLDEPRGKVLEILGGERIDCPDQRLVEDFSGQTRARLEDAWFKSSSGVIIFQLPQANDRQFITEIRSNLSSVLEILKNTFSLVFFDLSHDINAVSRRVLRLSDAVLLLASNSEGDIVQVQTKLKGLREIIRPVATRLKVGISHFRGETGLYRAEIRTRLNLAEVPDIWCSRDEKQNVSSLRRLAREVSRRRVGIALGAGGARGWAHLGVLKALESRGIPIDMIAGCSIGAIAAALYGKTGSAEKAIELIYSRFSSIRQVKRNIYDYSLLLGGGILKGDRILAVLDEMMEGAEFVDMLVPISIVAVDMTTGGEVILEEGSVSRAVRASISSPGMFCPFNLNGRWLTDGALINPLPVDVLINKGADFLLASVVEARGPEVWPEGGRPSILGTLSRCFSITFSRAARENINKADICIHPDVRGYRWGDYHQGKELIRKGEDACLEKIDEIEKLVFGGNNKC
ncbi:MAG: patatin-like phospholipase family protein [Pseudomonadota bacterium]